MSKEKSTSSILADCYHELADCCRELKQIEKKLGNVARGRLNGVKRVCMYPRCFYYDDKAKTHCCDACGSDHYDYERLHKRGRDHAS